MRKKISVGKKIKKLLFGVCLLSGLLFMTMPTSEAALDEIVLPQPQIQDGVSVMQALAKRQTNRNFADANISPAQISHILWAADGINRPEKEGRTNPAALGIRSVEVYVVTAEGDFRTATSTGQTFVGKAPLTLVYVADSAAWQNARRVPPTDQQAIFDSIAAGAMAQSVGLVAAAEGLGTCVRGSVDHEAFGKAARLSEGQKVIIAQTIGVLP